MNLSLYTNNNNNNRLITPRNGKWISGHRKFYNTRQWKALRLEQLEQYPLCYRCNNGGIIKNGTEVDHCLRFLNAEDELSYDPTNLVTLCASCHGYVTYLEKYNNYNRYTIEEAKAIKYKNKVLDVDGYYKTPYLGWLHYIERYCIKLKTILKKGVIGKNYTGIQKISI